MAGAKPFSEYGITPQELKAALDEQTPFLLYKLGSRRWELDDIQAQVAYETVKSLPSWDRGGRPRLAAWAHGVASRVFLEWCRSAGAGRGPGGTSLISADSLAEDGVEFVAVTPFEEDERTQARYTLICRLQQAVLSQPGGAIAWREMVTDDYKVRGRTAAARLQFLLAVVVDPDGTLRRAAGLLGHDGLEDVA